MYWNDGRGIPRSPKCRTVVIRKSSYYPRITVDSRGEYNGVQREIRNGIPPIVVERAHLHTKWNSADRCRTSTPNITAFNARYEMEFRRSL
ncbi:hypothetical protein QE152_g24943 [Popillia japonica]|uniref:Uncharacterized protein n=1 Tax=Popillia japonica TaxID=7064 RepID=A0AAW1K3R6_POPJA